MTFQKRHQVTVRTLSRPDFFFPFKKRKISNYVQNTVNGTWTERSTPPRLLPQHLSCALEHAPLQPRFQSLGSPRSPLHISCSRSCIWMTEPPRRSFLPWQCRTRALSCPISSLSSARDNSISSVSLQDGHQSLWASRVVSLILPSMEAVRHVPQSMAVLQSTVTTGARWPPRLRQFSRTFSSLPSCRRTGVKKHH